MKKDSILLIGMPGCGKTTIGIELAKRLNYTFCDMDKYIEDISKRSIKELFDISEDHFRDYESRACRELKDKKLSVISSGGGVVKREENVNYFRENSIVIFIDRPVELIIKDVDTTSRPLLKDGATRLYNLYSERYNLYNKYCTFKVSNTTSIEDVLDKIINIISKESNE